MAKVVVKKKKPRHIITGHEKSNNNIIYPNKPSHAFLILQFIKPSRFLFFNIIFHANINES